MSQSDFDRILAAMKAARARITHRTPAQVEEDIRRAKLEQLEDLALTDAARELRRFMLPKQPKRKGAP